MIGILCGQVVFSDGEETLIQTSTGIGYQTYCRYILPEGELTSLFVSHIIRETNEDLYCFKSLREKKLFEILTTVKGVGPKSAFNLVSNVSTEDIIGAVQSDQKKTLTQVSGIGTKAAAQIILDLKGKIQKVKMYSNKPLSPLTDTPSFAEGLGDLSFSRSPSSDHSTSHSSPSEPETLPPPQEILDDTLLACKNLGFQSDQIIPLAQRILRENPIKKTEQLIHLVLKEI